MVNWCLTGWWFTMVGFHFPGNQQHPALHIHYMARESNSTSKETLTQVQAVCYRLGVTENVLVWKQNRGNFKKHKTIVV